MPSLGSRSYTAAVCVQYFQYDQSTGSIYFDMHELLPFVGDPNVPKRVYLARAPNLTPEDLDWIRACIAKQHKDPESFVLDHIPIMDFNRQKKLVEKHNQFDPKDVHRYTINGPLAYTLNEVANHARAISLAHDGQTNRYMTLPMVLTLKLM